MFVRDDPAAFVQFIAITLPIWTKCVLVELFFVWTGEVGCGFLVATPLW